MAQKKIEFDIFRLMNFLRQDKRQIGLYCLCGAVISIIVAFSIPRIYKSNVILAPESSNSGALSSNISSLASMIGMNMQVGNGIDAIYPEIYPDLMQSTDFLVSLFPIRVESKDGTIKTDYFNYLSTMQKISWWNYPMEWLKKLINSLSAKDENQGKDGREVNPFMLTRKQYGIAKSIRNNIECSVDKKTSIISIEVTDQDPLIAATVADSVKERLQAVITDYRTNKARNDLAYMEQLLSEAHGQYTKARQKYAQFSDSNQDLLLESYRSKQEDLENEMQLKYNIYTQVAQQAQMAQAKVQERTPAFTVVQSATVPVKHSNMPKVVILGIFVFLAFMLRTLIVCKRHFKDIVLLKE